MYGKEILCYKVKTVYAGSFPQHTLCAFPSNILPWFQLALWKLPHFSQPIFKAFLSVLSLPHHLLLNPSMIPMTPSLPATRIFQLPTSVNTLCHHHTQPSLATFPPRRSHSVRYLKYHQCADYAPILSSVQTFLLYFRLCDTAHFTYLLEI